MVNSMTFARKHLSIRVRQIILPCARICFLSAPFYASSHRVQRYRCQTCKQTFTETKGTLFYRCRHSEEEIGECLAMVGDRNSLAAIHRMKGIKEETVCRWMERAATEVEQIEEQLVGPKKLSRVQMDALWAYVGHKGEKGGGQKKMHEGRFGEAPPSTCRP